MRSQLIRATKNKKLLFVLGATILIALNFCTLVIAYPVMTHTMILGGSKVARDFSVYYIGAWRLIHNPSNIYHTGFVNDGEPTIIPAPTPYKYLPSFLLMFSPLLALNYQQAFLVFDGFQFALLPLMALLIYKLFDKKGSPAMLAVAVVVLLLPCFMPNRGFSVSYYMQWAEGQAKVFLTFLLLLSYYCGKSGHPEFSGVVFGLAFFDPRFALLGLPLFLFYNTKNLKESTATMIFALLASNLMIFYPGILHDFANMVLNSGFSTPFYTPSWIPTFTLIALLIVNGNEFKSMIRRQAEKKLNTKPDAQAISRPSNIACHTGLHGCEHSGVAGGFECGDQEYC